METKLNNFSSSSGLVASSGAISDGDLRRVIFRACCWRPAVEYAKSYPVSCSAENWSASPANHGCGEKQKHKQPNITILTIAIAKITLRLCPQ